MPKRITIYLIVIITLASLLMVLGCGSGDKGAMPRLNAGGVISGGTDTSGGGGGTGGGNSSGSGVCIVTFDGGKYFTFTSCYAGRYTQAECNGYIDTDVTVAWHSDATSCQPYGYTLGDCFGDTSYTTCIK